MSIYEKETFQDPGRANESTSNKEKDPRIQRKGQKNNLEISGYHVCKSRSRDSNICESAINDAAPGTKYTSTADHVKGIRTTLSNRYRQHVTTMHGRQEHKQSITNKSKSSRHCRHFKKRVPTTLQQGRTIENYAVDARQRLTASSGARAWYSFHHTARTHI